MFVRKRTDLPEMRWTLALVSVLVSVGCAWLGTVVSTSPAGGLLWALLLWSVSTAFYSGLILLWHNAVWILVTPITGFCLWASGYGLFTVLSVSLALLFIARLAAAGWLEPKTRFVRMALLSCGIAFVLAGCLFVGLSLQYASFDAFYADALVTVDLLLTRFAEAGNTTFSSGTASALLHTMFLSLPALLGVTAELLAASVLFLCRTFLRILDCEEYFHTAADDGITTPRSFGAVSLVVLLMALLTSPYDNPLLYSILSNILSVLSLPCAYVGIRELFRRMQHRFFFYRLHTAETQRRPLPLSTVLLFVFLTLVMGLSTALSLSSALGAFYILRAKKIGGNTADKLS